jgi:hypothetical protein
VGRREKARRHRENAPTIVILNDQKGVVCGQKARRHREKLPPAIAKHVISVTKSLTVNSLVCGPESPKFQRLRVLFPSIFGFSAIANIGDGNSALGVT